MKQLKSVLRGALIICAVVASLFIGQVAQDYIDDAMHGNDPIRITFSPGGSIVGFIQDFTEARNSGKRYIVDGYCISACTLMLGLIPRDHVCVTMYAKFAFHSATVDDEFSPEGTRLAWHIYPEDVRALLRDKHNWDGEDPSKADHHNLIYIEGDELLTLIAPCKDNT